MSLVITPAESNQADLLSRLAQRAKAHWGYSHEFMQACKDELTYTEQALNQAPTYVAWREGQVLGFYQLVRINTKTTELEAMFVEPNQIESGVGTALFKHAMVQAEQMGFKQVLIQSDPNATAFYLKMGCIKAGEKQSLSVPGRVLPLLVFHL